ncbi:hypothetical protein DY000_02054988 [Brassica cretica]|uniref:Cation-transporting P-type ATPase N-terminal domain-containing protein n=1 Tax=Brassica cretica TaxID=69181 RepID=A0ABQ7AN10_BRACR|nr:hypothetical protein DY000_02054988 [Brassica cretica]
MAGDLDKPLLDPDTFNREGVDLGLLPLEEVFEHLRTTPRGLLSEEAEERLKIFGLNRLEEKQENKFLKFLGFMWNPLSWVMEAAALIAIALANSESQGPDWEDFVGIVCLLLINATISFFEENNAGNAAAALMARLALKTRSVLTGESLPVTKKKGEQVFSGSTCKQGEIEAVVIATGSSTFFGKTACLVDSTDVTGHLQQEIPERSSNSPGGPWKFCGLLPLFDPPRHDSGETILRALNLGVCVKMITGDQLAIAKETGRRLGMGTNMYPSSSLLGHNNNDEHEAIPVDELIEMADGFAGVFPEHKYEIVKILQEKKHVVGMTGDGVNDAPALKKADIGIAVADATDAARSSADIVLTEPGLSVIISAVLTSRAIFQRMKNYTLGFTLLALIWEYDFPPFMVLIIAILNDGTIMTISKDRVRPSPTPESWKLNQIFATGIVIGTYLALVTVLFYWLIVSTTFFEKHFHVKSIAKNTEQVSSAVYLQVSIISQALIFVTRSRSWSFLERPGTLLIFAFLVAQLAATLIAVYAKINFANITGIGWGWAGVIWLYSLIFYVPLDVIKFVFNYALSGDAWNLVLDRKTAFTYKKDDGTANVTITQRSHSAEELSGSRSRPSWIAEQTRRRAEIARLVEGHSVSRHLESVIKLKQIDSKMIRAAHTV